jgi:hypothetical protein
LINHGKNTPIGWEAITFNILSEDKLTIISLKSSSTPREALKKYDLE